MTMKLYSEESIQAIANAIRTQNGSSDTYTVGEMADAILDMSGGGFTIDDIALRRPAGDFVLTAQNLPERSLYKYTHITGLSSDTVRSCGNYAFSGMTSLVYASFPNLDGSINSYAFQDCSSLTRVYLPKCKTINSYSFQKCSSLVKLALPAVTSATGADLITSSNLLEELDLYAPTRIDATALRTAAKFDTLVLRKSTGVVQLLNVNAFTGTPFANSNVGGTLFVPKSLITSYKGASNWYNVCGYTNNMILPIEGSYYETHYCDGTSVEGATESSPIYCVSGWAITGTNNEVPYISKGTSRGACISVKGEHPIHLNAIDGKYSKVYPIPIPTGKTGVTITSDSMDVGVIECKYTNNDWLRIASSGWMLMSGGTSHSYNFTDNSTTHIYLALREAGNDSGTVTDAMCNALTLTWL